MDKYRVWFGFEGEAYAGEDPACPSYWRGSGVYDVFENKAILAVADIWCKEEHVEDKVQELIDKEFDINVGCLEIVKVVKLREEDDDDPDEYIDDWHVIEESKGQLPAALRIESFAKLWDPRKKMYPGDVFCIDGKIIEVL